MAKSTQGGTTVDIERTIGQLSGAVSALVAAGWSNEQIVAAAAQAIRDGRALSDGRRR
jgi:hypothetical protein